MAQEAKRAGGGWDALGADVKAFSKRLGVADGDIDVLIASLGAMEGRLDESMAGGIADAQNLIGSLQGVKDTILAIPSAQLDGDPGPLLAAIDAAMAGLMQLLALIDQTGMAPAGTGGRRGGGGGGGSKKSDAGGAAKDADRAQEEAYRREIERIEHKRHMNEMTAREEIEALGRVKREHAKTAEQIMDIDERIYDARKALREGEEEKITALGDALTDALQNRYEAQRKAEQQRIRDSIKAWETWSDETCAAIQKQLDALDEQEEAEEREEKRAEHPRKIGRLEQAIAYETDDYNRAQLQKQLEEAKRAYEQALGDWAREDERKALEDQMDAIRDQADKEIGKLEDESERIDSVYDELTKGASLAAEAQKLLMQSSQEELLALLGEFAPDYEATGRTLGEKLYEGFAAAFGNVEAFFASFDARFEAMADRAQQAALGNTQGIVQSGGDKASVSAPTVNQTVIFNEPVESPADVARRMQRISEELAGMM